VTVSRSPAAIASYRSIGTPSARVACRSGDQPARQPDTSDRVSPSDTVHRAAPTQDTRTSAGRDTGMPTRAIPSPRRWTSCRDEGPSAGTDSWNVRSLVSTSSSGSFGSATWMRQVPATRNVPCGCWHGAVTRSAGTTRRGDPTGADTIGDGDGETGPGWQPATTAARTAATPPTTTARIAE